ncbi:MAG TPA: RNA polymerase sigma factor [Kofleriaceae bacterium]|nr:RNA polymerase sigma factor [Kofleriaceae bacterium]
MPPVAQPQARPQEEPPAWVQGLVRGDPAAFDEVFLAYRRRIFGYFVRMTGRGDLAEDLTQEVFLRLARSARGLRPDTRLRAWLFTVAHNVLVSHARAARVTAALASELAERPRPAEATPFEAMASSATSARVERALEQLPAACREVILLVAIEGLPAAEAGAALGLSAEAVRQRLHRARTLLTKALDPDAPRRTE